MSILVMLAMLFSFATVSPAHAAVGIVVNSDADTVADDGFCTLVRWPTVDKAQVLTSLARLHLQQYTAIGTALLAALITVHPGAAVDPKYDLFSRTDNLPEPWTGASVEFPVRLNEKPPEPGRLNPSAFIILVSDGKSTLGVPENKAAEIVAAYGIRVSTIGVVAFGGYAEVVRWPTVDKSQVLTSLARLHLQQYTAVGTALLAALITVHRGGDNSRPPGMALLHPTLLTTPQERQPCFMSSSTGSSPPSAPGATRASSSSWPLNPPCYRSRASWW